MVDKSKMRQITFYEDGSFDYKNFNGVYDLIGMLQASIFQNWDHKVFQAIFLQIQQTLKENIEKSKIETPGGQNEKPDRQGKEDPKKLIL